LPFWIVTWKKCTEVWRRTFAGRRHDVWSILVGRLPSPRGTGLSNIQVIIFSCMHRIKDYGLISVLLLKCKFPRFKVSSAVSHLGCYSVIWYVGCWSVVPLDFGCSSQETDL
jgi:hypothetical protein